MPDITIRERRDDDIPELAHILVEVHRLNGYPVEGVTNPEAWLRRDELLGALVVERGGRLVGQVSVTQPEPGDDAARMLNNLDGTPLDRVAVIGRLFVDPAARGQRVGELLMIGASELATNAGRRAVLDVMKKDRAAISTYERLGWSPLGEFGHSFAQGVEPAIAYVDRGSAPGRG